MITQYMFNKLKALKKIRDPQLDQRELDNYNKWVKSLSHEIQEDMSDSS